MSAPSGSLSPEGTRQSGIGSSHGNWRCRHWWECKCCSDHCGSPSLPPNAPVVTSVRKHPRPLKSQSCHLLTPLGFLSVDSIITHPARACLLIQIIKGKSSGKGKGRASKAKVRSGGVMTYYNDFIGKSGWDHGYRYTWYWNEPTRVGFGDGTKGQHAMKWQ